jgi:ribosome-binding protein aMBF1 (putative translation factor)
MIHCIKLNAKHSPETCVKRSTAAYTKATAANEFGSAINEPMFPVCSQCDIGIAYAYHYTHIWQHKNGKLKYGRRLFNEHVPTFKGDILREKREAQGISRRELAAKININIGSLCNYECDNAMPSPKRLEHMESILGGLRG